MNTEEIRNLLFFVIKAAIVMFTLFHLATAILAWRQIVTMGEQVKTPTGIILNFLNLFNIAIVIIEIVGVIFLLDGAFS